MLGIVHHLYLVRKIWICENYLLKNGFWANLWEYKTFLKACVVTKLCHYCYFSVAAVVLFATTTCLSLSLQDLSPGSPKLTLQFGKVT